MILLDYNQTVITSFTSALAQSKKDKKTGYSRYIENILEEDGTINKHYLKHIVLYSIKRLNKRFRKEYGRLIICADSDKVWRKDFFPYYKANRAIANEKSEINWNHLYSFINEFIKEIDEHLPYPVLIVDKCEADDIIGALVRKFKDQEKILILSGDQDFCQLHYNDNIKQYDDVRNRFIEKECPIKYLKEKIIRGDSGDGCPSYLSEDNAFVIGKRQKPITAKKIDSIIDLLPEEFCNDEELKRYRRNEILIDLSFTPESYTRKIYDKYECQKDKKNNVLKYLISHGFSKLIEDYTDF